MSLSNLHTHSFFSDGENTVEEIVEKAIQKNFKSIGMSDHSFTDFDDSFCMKENLFDSYIEKMSQVKEIYKDKIEVLTGMELDYYSENIDTSKLDYVIGSVHYVKDYDGNWYWVDHTKECQQEGIDKDFWKNKNAFAKAYFNNLCDHMQKNRPDIVGHFDVVAKFNLMDEDDKIYRNMALESIDTVIDLGIVTEINTGAVARKYRHIPYPNSFILKRIKERGGKVVINADAHVAENIDFYFEEAKEIMKQCGFKSAFILTSKGFEEYAL